jgi:hypothetical protein
MTYTPKRLGSGVMTTSLTAAFTASGGTCLVRQVNVVNTSVFTRTFSLSTSAAPIVQERSLAPGASYDFYCYAPIEAGQSFYVQAGAGSDVSYQIWGDLVT